MGKEIRSGFGSYFKDDQEEGRPMRLSASELPPDNILFTNNDRVYGVTYHFFKGLEVKADHYTVQHNGVNFTTLPDQDLRRYISRQIDMFNVLVDRTKQFLKTPIDPKESTFLTTKLRALENEVQGYTRIIRELDLIEE